MKRIILLSVLVLFVLIGCSSHDAVRQSNLSYDLTAQQNKVVENGIELMIKPIHLKSELSTYFDDDLLKYGVLPIQVALFNKSNNTIYFSTEGINLIDSSGRRCPSLPVQTVIEKTKRSYWRSAGWTLAFGIFGLIPSAINVNNTNKKIQADYDSRIIKSGNMVKGSITEGLTFFEVPQNINTLDGWKFAVAFKDPQFDQLETIEYNLCGSIEKREIKEEEKSDTHKSSKDS